MSPISDEVNEWIRIAKEDLKAAQILLSYHQPVIGIACFHCQQAIEKLLKAFLVWKGKSFGKTHDLTYLLELCEEYGFDAIFLKDKAEALTSYAVDIRYPSISTNISKEEANEALEIANNVWRLISNIISI
ncbi:MAG: HEPN domain-containing protein [bacterium]